MFTGPLLEMTDVVISPCLGIGGRGGRDGDRQKTPGPAQKGH